MLFLGDYCRGQVLIVCYNMKLYVINPNLTLHKFDLC